MDNNVQFIMSDPMKGAKRPKTTGVKVDSNGVPLDIIAKQKENQKAAPDDITNDPAFMEMFGHVGKEQKDPWKKGGNEDNWYSGSPKPIPPQPTKQDVQPAKEPIDMGSNDITNDPEFEKMFGKSEVVNNESDSSDSHMNGMKMFNK